MRTYEFRGQQIDGMGWVYGDLIRHYENQRRFIAMDQLAYETSYCGIDRLVSERFHEVTPETVGQFTGLKDKNGKEIYEGDVVRYDDISDLGESLGEVAVVEYMDDQGCFDPLAIGYSGCYYSRYIENTEVIGNIHDNPELLGERK